MGIFFVWLIGSLVVGFLGSGRKVGFGGAFLFSLFLSPLIGAIIAVSSKSNEDAARGAQPGRLPLQQAAGKPAQPTGKSIPEELEALRDLKEKHYLTEMEYEQAKARVLAGGK